MAKHLNEALSYGSAGEIFVFIFIPRRDKFHDLAWQLIFLFALFLQSKEWARNLELWLSFDALLSRIAL